MSTSVERINLLLSHLPDKDIKLGNKLLQERNFEGLEELVDSAICKIKKNLISTNPKEEYLKIDFEELNKLKLEIDNYITYLEPPESGIYEY